MTNIFYWVSYGEMMSEVKPVSWTVNRFVLRWTSSINVFIRYINVCSLFSVFTKHYLTILSSCLDDSIKSYLDAMWDKVSMSIGFCNVWTIFRGANKITKALNRKYFEKWYWEMRVRHGSVRSILRKWFKCRFF